MALHTPVQHAGMAGSHLLRNFLAVVGIAIAVIVVAGLLATVRLPASTSTPMPPAQRAVLEYRAAERADWAAGVTTEAGSLIEFRAAERAGR